MNPLLCCIVFVVRYLGILFWFFLHIFFHVECGCIAIVFMSRFACIHACVRFVAVVVFRLLRWCHYSSMNMFFLCLSSEVGDLCISTITNTFQARMLYFDLQCIRVLCCINNLLGHKMRPWYNSQDISTHTFHYNIQQVIFFFFFFLCVLPSNGHHEAP
jgi:hypothetical protein